MGSYVPDRDACTGSVRVLGRRQIEMYSKLIHTVDHVEGYLRPEFDALDAFLCHTLAVTVTGAPKTWAIQVCVTHDRMYLGAVRFGYRHALPCTAHE